MPCSDGSSPEAERRELQVKLDRLTQMICAYCKWLQSTGSLSCLNEEMTRWWKLHQEADRLRIERERSEAAELLKRQADAANREYQKYLDLKRKYEGK